jgi:hypothetical protein
MLAGGQVALNGKDPAQLAAQLGQFALQYLRVGSQVAPKSVVL